MGKNGAAIRAAKEQNVVYTFTKEQLRQHDARKRRMGRKNPIVSAMYIIIGMLMFACIVSNTLGVFLDCSVYAAACICLDGMCCD